MKIRSRHQNAAYVGHWDPIIEDADVELIAKKIHLAKPFKNVYRAKETESRS